VILRDIWRSSVVLYLTTDEALQAKIFCQANLLRGNALRRFQQSIICLS
jgi:hypothetical protein